MRADLGAAGIWNVGMAGAKDINTQSHPSTGRSFLDTFMG